MNPIAQQNSMRKMALYNRSGRNVNPQFVEVKQSAYYHPINPHPRSRLVVPPQENRPSGAKALNVFTIYGPTKVVP